MGAETPRAAVRAWRDGLVNLDAGNRLLNHRPSATGSLAITGPAAPDVVAALGEGRAYGFLPAGARPTPGCLFRTGLAAVPLGTTLRRLLRKSRQDLLDRGVATLHLAVGALHWRDEEDTPYTSPVLLLPVELVARGPGDVPQLRERDDEAVVNPALVLRLRRMGIVAPGLSSLGVRAYLEELRATVSNRDWRADESLLLSCFSFHKEAMYRDLLDNESQIVRHPLVAALAGDPGAAPVEVGTDAGGVACGQTVSDDCGGVKSATISPTLSGRVVSSGQAASSGQAVPSAGGGFELPFVLDADATQRACVEAAVAGRSFVLDGPPGTGKSQTIANMIGCLLHAGKRVLFVSEKAAALEVVRNRLAAVGLDPYLLELHSHKATRKEVARALAESTAPAPESGTPVDRARLRELTERLDGYARAMNERREPLGRTLHEVLGECARLAEMPAAPMAPDAGLDLERLRQLLDAADELARCRRAGADDFPWRGIVATEPLHDTVGRAITALRAFEAALKPYGETGLEPAALAAVVTHTGNRPAGVPDEWLSAPTTEPIDRAADELRSFTEAARQARAAAGVEWNELPELHPPALEQTTLTASAAEAAARRNTVEATALEDMLREAGPLAVRLGLPDVATFGDLGRFAVVAELAARPHRPEPFWFGPGVLTGVAEAAAVLRRCAEAVGATGAECRRWFLDTIVDQPVEQLADRLAHEHRGLRKLLPAYRRDWDAVAGFALPAVSPADAVARLGAAVAWQRALRERAAAERQYAPLLGRYRRDEFSVEDALRTAADLVRLCPPDALPTAADLICRPDPVLARLATRARIVAAWEAPTETLSYAAARRRAAIGPLTEAATVLAAFDRVLGRHVDLAEADHLARLRATVVFHATDVDADMIAWARAARGKPLIAGDGRALTDSMAAWENARDAVAAAFAPGREIDEDFLTRLGDDPHGQQERLGYDHACKLLPAETVDFCRELPSEQVRPVVERALWTSWVDAVVRDDERLRPVDGLERDRLVEEFRALDAALAGAAPAIIGAAVDGRRAEAPDETALLRREGRKQNRHLPVRDLIGQARATVQSAKPCFLMSPLAVSQYLPPDLTFDVVIFDEASQIAPADAINCIYRAGALIAAGDDRQLPPTSFFSTRADRDDGTDVNDFQSVLELAQACGAFPSLSLGWHYRSRHEALIAFANHRFYQGRLLTFPGANADPETGVELVPAPGVYRRGGARDNPVEAEAVAGRIIACLTTRPELSLGVVTFSVAQAEAIEAAVERAAARHPGLERLLDGDRLTGFFVKSLESVQGDERDVMIFSIGYGRDEQGRVSTNFGALNQPNGWRRLNVAITRARRRVEIISSVRARDLPESANPGVRHLAAYLEYAERGLPAAPTRTADADSLVSSVLETVRSWGYDANASVGGQGYRVDIGVRHPTPGHGYVLGIECDGPRYGSIGAARDRDRLTHDVLTGLGWRLHRVWGTAWHHDRAGEENRLHAAIKEAVGPLPARRQGLLRLQPVG